MVDENIFCRKKGCANPKCELHHLIPRAIGGKDMDGRAYLCEKHHDILHKSIIKTIWRFVPIEKQDSCKKAIEEFGRWWIEQADY